jgi:hypothetical protein
MEFNAPEVLKKYKKELKFAEQAIKEKLIEEQNINQKALDKTILNLKEINNILNNLLDGQTEQEFKEYTLDKTQLKKFEDIKNKQKLYQELKHDLKKELQNINAIIKTIPEYINTVQHFLLVKGVIPVYDTEKYNKSKKEFYRDYIQEVSGQTNTSMFYSDIIKSFLNRSFNRIIMIIPIIEKINKKVAGISRGSEYYDQWQLAHILHIPFTLEPFVHIEEKPTIWNKIKNWFSRYKLVTTEPSKRILAKSQLWETPKQWAGQLKTRAKSALEKKAERYQAQERYIPAGWVVDPWQ